MLGILIIFIVVTGSFSLEYGPCPEPASEFVDFKRFAGEWLEYRRSRNTEDETACCGRLNLRLTGKNKAILSFSAISSLIDGNSTLPAIAKINNTNKILVDLYLPVLGILKSFVYWVLETDYTKYFIVWTCENDGPNHVSKVFVKLRDLNCADGIDAIITKALKKRGLAVPPMTKPSKPSKPAINCY